MSEWDDLGAATLDVDCPLCHARPGYPCRGSRIHPPRYVEGAAEIDRRREETRKRLARLGADVEGRVTLRTPLPVAPGERDGVTFWRSRY